jgi:hypothetical protein
MQHPFYTIHPSSRALSFAACQASAIEIVIPVWRALHDELRSVFWHVVNRVKKTKNEAGRSVFRISREGRRAAGALIH